MAITTPPPNTAIEQVSYEDLYARWEKLNWRATDIDFSQDRIDWHEKLSDEQRAAALWLYTLFLHGEDSVADNLSPYIDAAPKDEQKYFLTTQQVDEARHAVFFKRFMHEVVGIGDGSIASSLSGTLPELTWGHRKVFGHLDEVADQLRKDRSPRMFASAITLYHLIVEASLAQPAQHCIEDSLERMDLMPGFRAGMRNVAVDEQRHIAFGVRALADLYEEDPVMTEDAITQKFKDVISWTTAVALPKDGNMAYLDPLGFSLADLFEEGARSIEFKLKSIGLDTDNMPRFPFPLDLEPSERARRGIALMENGFVGPGDLPVRPTPEVMGIVFDQLRRTSDPSVVKPGTTLLWDFSDTDPWHLVFDNGTSRAVQGRPAGKADVTFRCRIEDWAGIIAGRDDPMKLMLQRRLKTRGNPRVLVKLNKLLG